MNIDSAINIFNIWLDKYKKAPSLQFKGHFYNLMYMHMCAVVRDKTLLENALFCKYVKSNKTLNVIFEKVLNHYASLEILQNNNPVQILDNISKELERLKNLLNKN